MSFGLYLTGFIVLIVGLAIGANMLHIPPQWIGVGIVVMIGLGILSGVTITRIGIRQIDRWINWMPMSVMFAVALASTPHDRANHRFGILSFDLLARGRVSTLNFGRH